MHANTNEHGYPPAGHRKLLPPSIVQQLEQAPGHPTCLAALHSHQPRPALRWPPLIFARNEHYYCLTSAQAQSLAEHGTTEQHPRSVFSLAVSRCKCKAKTAILTNIPPQQAHITTLEQSTFGLASLVPDTVTIQLGLVVRGRFRPSTDLDLQPQIGPPNFFGHTTYTDYGGRLEWLTANGPKLITELFSKACTASVALLNTLRLTTVSIRQRAIFYGTYCLSKFTYVASYALVTPKDIARMQVLVARAILRRPWIKASHLAGTLRALRIAPMQDPEIAIACAALGLLERRGKEDEELCAFLQQQDTSFEGDRQYDTALIYLKRYLPTLPQADVSTIQQIIKTAAFAQKQQHGPLTQPSYKTGLAKHFKTAMKTSRENNAMEHLRSRTTTTWNAAPSYTWLQALTNLHPRLCGAIPRYALLRWSIGHESDCAFWNRFHKLGRCVCGCGRLADTYPQGLTQAPLAEHHMAEYQNPAAHLHPDYDIIAQHTLPLEVYTQVKHYAPSEAARAYPHAYYQVATIGPLSHSSTPCVLCGKGDNCVDHWMRHCIVLPLTLALLIGARALQGIEQIAQQSQHGLALATQIIFQLRRTIHEKGGLNQVPPAHPEPNSPPVIRAICEQIAGAVVELYCTTKLLFNHYLHRDAHASCKVQLHGYPPCILQGSCIPPLPSQPCANCRQVLLSSSLTNMIPGIACCINTVRHPT